MGKGSFLQRVRGNAEWDTIKYLGGSGVLTAVWKTSYALYTKAPFEWKFWGVIFLGGVCFSAFGYWRQYKQETPEPSIEKEKGFQALNPEQLQLVTQKSFLNETVEIDGKFFLHCTFNHVRLKYNGCATFSMNHCKVSDFTLATDNPSVEGAWVVVKALGFLRASLGDETGKPLENIQGPK